jgi:hypothetical protein
VITLAVPAVLVAALLGLKQRQPGAGPRLRVVRAAVGELGSTDAQKYVRDALGREADLEWCGLFALWALHRAGLALDWKWEIGDGFLYRLPQIRAAQVKPGDMIYFDRPYQHHAIVESINHKLGLMSTLNGNGGGGAVTRVVRPISDADGFYTIDPLVEQQLGRAA